MASPTGRGDSMGAALNDLLRSQVTPRHRLSSYNAKHWHAQLSQLLRLSGWGRWVDSQAGGGEAAVDQSGLELDSA
jgi:hypothetical protein